MKKYVLLFILVATVLLSGCEVTTPENDLSLQEYSTDDFSVESTPSPDSSTLQLENTEPNIQAENIQGETMQNESTPIAATQATIKTDKGDIVIKLYGNDAPNTVANFVRKADDGFYENLNFHRVEDWVIQGGDPLGNGTGGGKMATELNSVPFKEGSVGVARGGDIKVSNDAQFFICTTDCAWLTGQYTNFGEVIEGMDIAKQIAIGDKIISVTYQ